MEYVKKTPVLLSSSYPWQGAKDRCRIKGKRGLPSISGYHILESGNEENLKYRVALVGPVAVSFEFSTDLQFYSSNVFFDPKCNQGIYERNFYALIVGYGTDLTLGPYWIVKFSWGSDFGEKGYVKMARGVNHCDIASAPIYAFF